LVSTAYKTSLLLPNGFAKKIELFLSTLNFSHIWENQNTFSNRLIDSLRACIDTGYIPNSAKTAALTAALFTPIKNLANLIIPTCILLYCSEVWSLNIIKDNTILESKYWNMAPVKIQIKFDKFLIGVNKAAVAFPKNWIDILKTESSVKSIVNIKKDYFIWNNQFVNSSTLSLIYRNYINYSQQFSIWKVKLYLV
jgi:hypothetical protein